MNDPVLTAASAAPTLPRFKQRDPLSVYVAMVIGGTIIKETSQFWEELGKFEEPTVEMKGFSFARTRLSGYGLGKSRNVATWMARQTNCGKFVFIDSDVVPNMDMLLRLVSHNVEAVSGFYPKKRADKLSWVGNQMGTGVRPDGLTEALDFGGGFCCLDLTAIDQLVAKVHDDTWYVCEDDPYKEKIMNDLWATGRVVDEWREDERRLVQAYDVLKATSRSLYFGVDAVADRAALHEDDRMMPVFARDGCG